MRSNSNNTLKSANHSTLENMHIICEYFENFSDRRDVKEQIDRGKENFEESLSMNFNSQALIAHLVVVVLDSIEDDSYHSHSIDTRHKFHVFLLLANRVSRSKLIFHSLIVPVVVLFD